MTISEVEETISQYKWLRDIKESYYKHIELIKSEKGYYTVHGIQYSARGDIRTFDINSHVSIDPKFMVAALEDALLRLDVKIDNTVEKLKQVGISVDE